MFFMSISTVPPDSVAAVLVPAGAWVAGAGWSAGDFLPEEPQPAAMSATRVAARSAIRVMPGTLHPKLHEHGGMVGERTAVEDRRLVDGAQPADEDVVDPVAAGVPEPRYGARIAHVEVPAEDDRRVGGPPEHRGRRLFDVGARALVGMHLGVEVGDPGPAGKRHGMDDPSLRPAAQAAHAVIGDPRSADQDGVGATTSGLDRVGPTPGERPAQW